MDAHQRAHRHHAGNAQHHGHAAEHLIQQIRTQIRQELVQVGAVHRDKVVVACLLHVHRQHMVQRLAAPQRRDHHHHVGRRDKHEVAELDVASQPQRQQHRQEEHRLQLEGQRHAEEDHAARAAPGQAHVHGHQAEGDVDHVALAPVRAVEDDRGQQGRDVIHQQRRAVALHAKGRELHQRGAHEHLKGDGDRLDQILRRIVLHPGDDLHQVQVRRRIVAADVPAKAFLPAHLGILIDPVAQEDVVIVAHIVEQRDLRKQHSAREHRQQDVHIDGQLPARAQLHRVGDGEDRREDHAGDHLHLAGLVSAEFVDLRIARIAREDEKHGGREHEQHKAQHPAGAPVQSCAQRVADNILFHGTISFLAQSSMFIISKKTPSVQQNLCAPRIIIPSCAAYSMGQRFHDCSHFCPMGAIPLLNRPGIMIKEFSKPHHTNPR